MAIVNRFSCSSMAGRPFADYLNISVPQESAEGLRDAVLPVLDALCSFQEVQPGLFQLYQVGVVKGEVVPVKLGTVKFGRRGRVATLSTSGQVLRILRERGLYGEYLSVLASFPHRVTMLHVTADFYDADPPSAVRAIKDAAYAGDLALTRKRILPSQCQHVFSVNLAGQETGTVYLGQRANADVWAKVYDKGHERVSRGFADPGPLVRVEVACMSDVGATLRDAFDPTDLFYQYAGRSLVSAPPDFAGWLPHGEGYVLGERRERTLFERFENLIQGSLDIHRLAQMAVDLYGPDIAPQALGRKVIALVLGPGVGSLKTT